MLADFTTEEVKRISGKFQEKTVHVGGVQTPFGNFGAKAVKTGEIVFDEPICDTPRVGMNPAFAAARYGIKLGDRITAIACIGVDNSTGKPAFDLGNIEKAAPKLELVVSN